MGATWWDGVIKLPAERVGRVVESLLAEFWRAGGNWFILRVSILTRIESTDAPSRKTSGCPGE